MHSTALVEGLEGKWDPLSITPQGTQRMNILIHATAQRQRRSCLCFIKHVAIKLIKYTYITCASLSGSILYT